MKIDIVVDFINIVLTGEKKTICDCRQYAMDSCILLNGVTSFHLFKSLFPDSKLYLIC